MTALLAARNLSKRFGGIVVADAVKIELRSGEIVGLIGPNGAGKTSLFNLLSGVVAPDSGEITLRGRRIEALPIFARARLGLARTWQHSRSFAALTALDNLLIAARDYPGESLLNSVFRPGHVKRTDEAAREQALAVLARIGLADRAESLSVDLSYGQQKLLGIGRALMNGGSCLLLDEPMAGVEGRTYAKIAELIHEEAAQGQAVCIVEHNVAFIRDLCHRGVFMSRGRILAEGPVEELMRDRALTSLYFGAHVQS